MYVRHIIKWRKRSCKARKKDAVDSQEPAPGSSSQCDWQLNSYGKMPLGLRELAHNLTGSSDDCQGFQHLGQGFRQVFGDQSAAGPGQPPLLCSQNAGRRRLEPGHALDQKPQDKTRKHIPRPAGAEPWRGIGGDGRPALRRRRPPVSAPFQHDTTAPLAAAARRGRRARVCRTPSRSIATVGKPSRSNSPWHAGSPTTGARTAENGGKQPRCRLVGEAGQGIGIEHHGFIVRPSESRSARAARLRTHPVSRADQRPVAARLIRETGASKSPPAFGISFARSAPGSRRSHRCPAAAGGTAERHQSPSPRSAAARAARQAVPRRSCPRCRRSAPNRAGRLVVAPGRHRQRVHRRRSVCARPRRSNAGQHRVRNADIGDDHFRRTRRAPDKAGAPASAGKKSLSPRSCVRDIGFGPEDAIISRRCRRRRRSAGRPRGRSGVRWLIRFTAAAARPVDRTD